MKSKIISIKIFSFLMLFPLFSYSQIISSYGLKGGVVIAKQTFEYTMFPDLDTKYRTGIDIAISAELFNHPFWNGLVELHYIQKGFKITAPISTEQYPEGIGGDTTLYPRVDYLSLPLLLKIRFEGKIITPYFFIGPRIEMKLAYNSAYGVSMFKGLNAVDLGATFGVGIQFSASKKFGLLLEGRYSYPITSSVSNSFATVKNHSFEILAGISFKISKNKKL